MRRASPTARFALRGLFVIAFLYSAAVVTHNQLSQTWMLTEERVSLDCYIDGTVPRPFAYRTLIAGVLRAFVAITPQPMAEVFAQWGQIIAKPVTFKGFTTVWGQEQIRSGRENKYPQAIFILALVQFTCLIGYGLVGSALYACLFPDTCWRSVTAPLLLLLLVPVTWFGLGHIYDFSVLLFGASLLLAMAYRRHALYLLIFTIGCLNKETTILMALAYASVFFRRLPFAVYTFMLTAQILIFLSIYVAVRIIYAENSGGDMEIWILKLPGYYWSRPIIFYLIASVVAFSISFRWNEKPEFLRRASVMVIPHLVLILFAAAPGEWRNWYESFPLLSMFALRNMEFMYRRWWVPPTASLQKAETQQDCFPRRSRGFTS